MKKATKRLPFRIRYSLRALVIIMFVAFCALGWKVESAQNQRAAVAWVHEHGGTVSYAYQEGFQKYGFQDSDWHPYPPVPSAPVWLIDFLGIDFFEEVTSVIGLESVDDFSPLLRLPHLRRLWISNSSATEMKPLSGLKKLETLELYNVPVRDIRPLARLDKLKHVELSATKVEDISPLSDLSRIEFLSLSQSEVDDVKALSASVRLKVLILSATDVSDLSPLARLKSLQKVDLYLTRVSDAEVERFQKALPNCRIYQKTPLCVYPGWSFELREPVRSRD